MSIQEIRDNLNLGLILVNHPHGLQLDDVLIDALGYDPFGPWPTCDRDRYVSRLHEAQRLGLDKYARREPGYFTINAQPFGRVFVYKTVWYTWLNPATNTPCIVLICNTDLMPMRDWRDRYLATRTRTTRSVRAADNVIRQDRALARQDAQAVRSIQSGMVQDGTLSEIITGLLGVPFVEITAMMDLLAQGNPYGSTQFQFTREAQRIRQLENRLADAQANVVRSLANLVCLRQALPPNAGQLAIADAQNRLANLS